MPTVGADGGHAPSRAIYRADRITVGKARGDLRTRIGEHVMPPIPTRLYAFDLYVSGP